MAIDILTDLNIYLQAQNISTPTITGVYDGGSPPGTYVPGKDFSPTDNVSTGNTALLNFSIAFESESAEDYALDRVYIQSVYNPRTDGTGLIPGRWINQNPDPTDITDDGLNVIIPSYFANMSSIVFDESANIRSNSTVLTGITLTLPNSGFWWKSKIVPLIQVVAVKDGVTKTSDPFELPTLLLSTAGEVVSTLASSGNITYSSSGPSGPGFNIASTIITAKNYLSGISRILDRPHFDLITYRINYGVTVNGTPITLNNADFTLTTLGFGEIVSYNFSGGVLTVVVHQTQSGEVGIRINSRVPFDASGMNSALVTVSATWATTPPAITDFYNGYLFSERAAGSASRSVTVDTSDQPPELQPRIQETITGNLSNYIVGHTLTVTNYPCFRILNSSIIRMINSEIAVFDSNFNPSYSFYDTDGNLISGFLSADSYTILYGEYDYPAGFDPNAVGELVLNGGVELMSYDQLILLGKKPNVAMITLTRDLYAGYDVDYSRQTNFQFTGRIKVIDQQAFAELYQSNPKNSYPTNIYSYMSLASCYDDPASGYAAVGDMLALVDGFSDREDTVFLNLGTTSPPQSNTVVRFGANSQVRADIPFGTLTSYLLYAIGNTNQTQVNTITDYTQTYCLMLRWTVGSGGSVDSHIPESTVVTFTLPDNLMPYIYVSGMPMLTVTNGAISFDIPIPNYEIDGNKVSLTLPVAADMSPDFLCVPVRFYIPADDLSTSLVSVDFSQPLVYTEDPNSLIYGFTTDSLMFRVVTVTSPVTLRGAQIDNTGLTASPTVYNRGQIINYSAVVNNLSYTPSSDYCMSLSVPTNQYNPIESSNNNLPAYIRYINPINPATVVYFRTAATVTAEDIYIFKTLNRPGGPTLEEYFNDTIVNEWTLYTGQALPADVVLLAACTPDIPAGSLVRVDYGVEIMIPPGDETQYINDAAFHYYSSGANLESGSNLARVRNAVVAPIDVLKAPLTQIRELKNGVEVNFTVYFTAPTDYLLNRVFTLTDNLHPSLELDVAGCSAVAYPSTPVPLSISYDPVTNTATFEIENTPLTAGLLIILNIATKVKDITLIPNNSSGTPSIENKIDLEINHNPDLKSESNIVTVLFSIPVPVPVDIVKSPLSQTRERQAGEPVEFTLEFIAPAETSVYTSFTVTDEIHPALEPNTAGITVTTDVGEIVPADIVFDPLNRLLTIKFENTDLTGGKRIIITLPTVLDDLTALPPSNRIGNMARLIINNNPLIFSDSNVVEVIFGQKEDGREITDLIQSVALEQVAISHILNAEGEKLQLGISIAQSADEMLALNQSVQNMVDAVTRLENALYAKLKLFWPGCLCPE